jgi:dipeptidase E
LSERPRTIVAVGGGNFGTYPGNALDTFLLERALRGPRPGGATGQPRIAYLPTAGGDQEGPIDAFRRQFLERRALPTVVRLFQRQEKDLAAVLLAQDLVLVGGGNTANQRAIWAVHGVDAILREAYARGVLLAGWSAGGLCWFAGGITDSFHPTELAALTGLLGLLPGSFCPHYDSEATRRPTYQARVADGALPAGWAADDGVGLVFEEGAFVEAVTFLEGKAAWRVEPAPGDPGSAAGVRETRHAARFLPATP